MLQLIWYKALAELRAEASRYYLGFLWWVMEPLLYILAFYFVFAVGLRMGGEDYVPFLLCGLVPWKWFSSTITAGSTIILSNKGLMSQVYFHKSMLVGMLLTANLIKALIILGLLLIAILAMGYRPTLAWLMLPVLVLCQLIVTAGLASVCAATIPFLPDLRPFVDNGLMIAFFMSGIFFNIEDRAENIQSILYLNPMACIISAYRHVLLDGTWPDAGHLSYVVALGAVTALIGYRVISRFDRQYPKLSS